MRFCLILTFLLIFKSVIAQIPDSAICSKKPGIKVPATINDLGYEKMVYISKDSIRLGFRIVLLDPSYQIVGFRVYFFGKHMDLYWKDISGSNANETNLPILRNLSGEEWMEIECLTVTKKKQYYTALPFKIWITP